LRLTPEQLPAALSRGLASIYLVSGDEPLAVGECADAIRAAARAAGFAERNVYFIERGFNWDEVRHETQALSLFAERRLVELRMPSGKPDKGADLLKELADRPPPDVLCLVVSGKLDGKTADAPWVRAIEQHGAVLRIWPVATAAMPAWLAGRARGLGLRLEPAAAQLIIDRVEGNLLAAKQELDVLALLADGRPVGTELVLNAVGDSARYDVFQLGEAAASGDAQRALRILTGLRNEGVEPTLVLWALVRELRGSFQACERERVGSRSPGSGWNLAAKPSPRALARAAKMPLARLLRDAGRVDRIIKGLALGDAWSAVTALAADMSGALQATPDSGRVAV
jgi:DNA polymerase III subunit delta